jgi:hypothetical protein
MARLTGVFLIILTAACFAAAQPPPLDVTVQPVEGGAVVYSPIAPRSTDFGPEGQIGLLLKLENKGTTTLLINKINVRYEVSESIFGSASVTQDGIIPLSMGPGSVYYWCHQRDKDKDTMIYMPENWEPKKITISVYCVGCSQPVTVSMPLKKHPSPFTGGSYRFPTRAEDLGSGEYWSTSSSHGTSYFGSQLFAYDMGVTRWDSDSKQYSITKTGTTGCQISDYLSYGRPVYAMADGEVAWNPTNSVKDKSNGVETAWRHHQKVRDPGRDEEVDVRPASRYPGGWKQHLDHFGDGAPQLRAFPGRDDQPQISHEGREGQSRGTPRADRGERLLDLPARSFRYGANSRDAKSESPVRYEQLLTKPGLASPTDVSRRLYHRPVAFHAARSAA